MTHLIILLHNTQLISSPQVFLDLNMPIMDGCETCRRFREFETAYRLAQNDYDNYLSSVGNDINNPIVANATATNVDGEGVGAGSGVVASAGVGVGSGVGIGSGGSILVNGEKDGDPGTVGVPVGVAPLVPAPTTPGGIALAAFPGISVVPRRTMRRRIVIIGISANSDGESKKMALDAGSTQTHTFCTFLPSIHSHSPISHSMHPYNNPHLINKPSLSHF